MCGPTPASSRAMSSPIRAASRSRNACIIASNTSRAARCSFRNPSTNRSCSVWSTVTISPPLAQPVGLSERLGGGRSQSVPRGLHFARPGGSPAPCLGQPVTAPREQLGGLAEQRFSLAPLCHRQPELGSGLPHRSQPGPPLPHPRHPLRVVETLLG